MPRSAGCKSSNSDSAVPLDAVRIRRMRRAIQTSVCSGRDWGHADFPKQMPIRARQLRVNQMWVRTTEAVPTYSWKKESYVTSLSCAEMFTQKRKLKIRNEAEHPKRKK